MSGGAYSVFALRYHPNLFTGEFVNVGVAVVTSNGWWAVQFAQDVKDLRCLFPEAEVQSLRATLKTLSHRLGVGESSQIIEPAMPDDPLSVIRRRGGKLNGSLRWSAPVFEGVGSDADVEVGYWFESLVRVEPNAEALKLDRGAAASVPPSSASKIRERMAREFVRRGVIRRLRPAVIPGYKSSRFQYTYQNGALNIFEPVRLNYKSAATILSHGERWRGKLDILADSADQELAFFGLVDTNPDPKLESETEAALEMIGKAHLGRVETVLSSDVERFGQMVLDVVGGTT